MSAVFTAYRELSHELLVEEALRLRDENAVLRKKVEELEREADALHYARIEARDK